MALPVPNLDDKQFLQIAEEARSLIPSAAPEWTDHNVHDPGITFLELFAWLAEIEHYRLNRTSAASYARFFSLAGLTPRNRQAAEVAISFDFTGLNAGVLVKANTPVFAIGNEDLPFQTTRDAYLTTAKLTKVITSAGGREIAKTRAEENVAGYYEAFGPSPEPGYSLHLGFEGWFNEEQGQLSIILFEDDLPAKTPLAPDAQGFVSSAMVGWEYLTGSGWSPLDVIEDGTLHLSRSGDLIFKKPEQPQIRKNLYWLRVVLVEGRYEIPPRISSILTNTIRARQVETIVNEDHGAGLGTPDQIIRLRKAPVLLDPRASDGPFQVGEVLDWRALVMRLAKPGEFHPPRQAETVDYVARRLREDAGAVIVASDPADDEKYRLAQAFDRLLDLPDFYQRNRFPAVRIPEEFSELQSLAGRACYDRGRLRRFNRFLLQRVFSDLIVSDRVEIQTGTQARSVEEEPKSWTGWERVDDFSRSGPEDRHYVLDPETGTILFGNGLNGRVPQATELIRARFYRRTQGEKGNLPAGHQWQLAAGLPPGTRIERRVNHAPASGGAEPESIDEARARSREVFRKQSPMLTAKDYEAAALNTPGLRVARAKVVANFNPELPNLSLPGEVTVVVVPQPSPKAAFPNARPPEPSDGFRSTVRNHLETRRLVTTNIHVIAPQYVTVVVRCRVFLKKGASEKETVDAVKKALGELLDPVPARPARNSGWPFGRPVFPSEIHQRLAKIPGIDYVTGVGLNDRKAGEPLRLPYNGLPTPGDHRIEPVPFEKRRQGPDARKGGDCRD
ncbi:MAG TPA: putative baseplate assembly protein [Blastocatellia bacterium]|nr:putative baseplate assembly protein [Blastocatellia bacterium]